jgi:hypothetical protein
MADQTSDITNEEIDAANHAADLLWPSFIDQIADSGEDFSAVLYALWVCMTHALADDGWTAEQLTSDLQHHVALATSEGRVQ